jgi:hypothetical protein
LFLLLYWMLGQGLIKGTGVKQNTDVGEQSRTNAKEH